jgi:hypothetical protein
MTLYLSFRSDPVGGAVVEPMMWRGEPTDGPLALEPVGALELAALAAGKNILFATHGFNVSQAHGVRSLGQLEPQLALTSSDLYVAVLWPGDFWIPAVNYPFEGDTAMACGRKLARYCDGPLAAAQSFSFVSHSLGARLVLEAVKRLKRRARLVCLTAAAINRDCLATEYAAAASNAVAIAILASHADLTLKLAYPVGDVIAELLHEDHGLFLPALGLGGPPVPVAPPVKAPWQIADPAAYDHLDYLPPGDAIESAATLANAKWPRVAAFIRTAFKGEPQAWPT